MPKPIRSILAAAGLLAVAALAAAGLMAAGSPAHADCTVSGPSTAGVNQSFTLCAPTNSNSSYEWFGPGVTTSAYGRCVSVSGLAAGGYQFTLIRRVNGDEVERCTKTVNVGGSTGGTESCNISGPEVIESGDRATLCAPQDGLHTYSWSGPNGFVSDAACITVSDPGTYTLNSKNRLTGSSRNCSHRLAVNGYDNGGGATGDCDILGPSVIENGASVSLCGTSYANTSYRWVGPNGFVSSSRCVNADDAGVYTLTMRNLSTGYQRTCSQTLSMSGGGSTSNCGITGPTTIDVGTSASLCAPSAANTTYRWTGPNGFVSTSRCINASNAGTYYLAMRNTYSGQTTRCDTYLAMSDDNPDSPVSGANCPRDFQFWRAVSAESRRSNGSELSRNEYVRLAQAVDSKSAYFNWANDGDGLYAALHPSAPDTRRKQVIRQYAALLANVASADQGITASDGNNIALDLDTPVSFGGARTVGELIALTDRLLAGNRGDFAKLNSTLNRLNRGLGIPTYCQ